MGHIFKFNMGKMVDGQDILVCPKCELYVGEDVEALQCDGFCDKWHHAMCVNVCSEDYQKIQDLKDITKWICEVCAGKLKTMRERVIGAEEYIDLHDLTGKLLDAVKKITSDNVKINKKLDIMSNEHFQLNEAVSNLTSRAAIGVSNRSNKSNVKKSISTDSRSNTDIDTVQAVNQSCTQTTKQNQVCDVTMEQRENDFPPLPKKENLWKTVEFKKSNRRKNVSQQSTGSNEDRNGSGHENQATVPVSVSVSRRSVSRKKNNEPLIVGKSESPALGLEAGEKKAWLYLGRVKKGCTAEGVKEFISTTFPDIDAKVEQLDSKSINYTSFKICVDFVKKEVLMNEAAWPKNVILKRFLFRRLPDRTTT